MGCAPGEGAVRILGEAAAEPVAAPVVRVAAGVGVRAAAVAAQTPDCQSFQRTMPRPPMPVVHNICLATHARLLRCMSDTSLENHLGNL